MAKAGYELVDPKLAGDEWDYRIPGAAMDSGLSDKCYSFNWQQVDARWQQQHIETSDTAKIVAACLRKNGIQPRQHYSDNVTLLQKSNIDPGTC